MQVVMETIRSQNANVINRKVKQVHCYGQRSVYFGVPTRATQDWLLPILAKYQIHRPERLWEAFELWSWKRIANSWCKFIIVNLLLNQLRHIIGDIAETCLLSPTLSLSLQNGGGEGALQSAKCDRSSTPLSSLVSFTLPSHNREK